MTLDKAIEILDVYFVLNHEVGRADLINAAKLAIEALKHLQALRDLGYDRPLPILPGETEEEG